MGADLAKLSAETLATVINPAVVAVDQDALGLQAVKVAEPDNGVQVWAKPLSASGTKAVLLLNRTGASAHVSVAWKDLGFAEDGPATVKDLWAGKELGSFNGAYAADVAAGDAALLVMKGKESPAVSYRPESAKDASGCKGCELTFARVASRAPWARIRIEYRNPDSTAHYAELRVNGQGPTAIAFPPTGAQAGSISIMAQLDRTGAANVLQVFRTGFDRLDRVDQCGMKRRSAKAHGARSEAFSAPG